MQKFTLNEFIAGDLDQYWTIGNLEAHKYYAQTQIACGDYFGDDVCTENHGLFADTAGALMNYLCEPVDLRPDLDNPVRELYVSDTNIPFIAMQDDDRVGRFTIPYSVCAQDYVPTLPKSRRDKFKAAIKQEQPITLQHVPLSLVTTDRIVNERAKHYDEDPLFYRDFMDRLENETMSFFILQEGERVGVTTLVRSMMDPAVWYAYLFFTTAPCIRQVHLALVQDILSPGEILHYGASDSYIEERRKVFTYKQTISSHTLLGPTVAIHRPGLTRPYYDLNSQTWVR